MNRPFAKLFTRRRQQEISLSEERGIRYLHFGSVWIQGAMRIGDPYRLELEYTRELFAGLIFQPQPKAFTLIGLGAASATKFAWKTFARARVTTIELEPSVIACAHANFGLPPDSARLRTVCAEGEAWIAGHPACCDYLIVDAYDAAAKGPVLSTPEFYAHCRAALSIERTSVMAVNLFGKHASFQRNLRNIETAFDGRILVLPQSERGNVIAFGLAGPPLDVPLAELRARAAALKESSGINFQQFLAGFRSANLVKGESLQV
jgi:spermidine synthase